MTVGERIKQARIEKHLTQRQLGDLCGMADSAIRRYENGGANPKMETLEKIATALGVSIDYLKGWSEKFEDSPIYRAYKRNNMLDTDFFLDYKNHTLTEGIDWEPIDIEMIQKFKVLNGIGQAKAIDQVELLTKIPEYRKDTPNFSANAAHERTDVEITPEDRTADEDMLDD